MNKKVATFYLSSVQLWVYLFFLGLQFYISQLWVSISQLDFFYELWDMNSELWEFFFYSVAETGFHNFRQNIHKQKFVMLETLK